MGDGGDGGSGAGDGAGDGGGGGGGGVYDLPMLDFDSGWDTGWQGGALPGNDVNLTEEQQRRLRGMPANAYGWDFGLTQGTNNAMDFDPSWFSSLGYKGPLMESVGGSGGEGSPGAQAPAAGLREWMNKNGYELAQSYSGERSNNHLARMVDANGKMVGKEHSWSAVDDPGNIFGLAVMAAAGGFAAPAALAAAGGASVGSTAAVGAGINAGATYGSGGDWGDVAKAALAGGAGGAIGAGVDYVNPGGQMGLDGAWKAAVNKGVSGGLTSLATGGNPVYGAAAGAGGVGANQMWDSFLSSMGGSDFGQNFSSGFSSAPPGDFQQWKNDNQGYSSAPQQGPFQADASGLMQYMGASQGEDEGGPNAAFESGFTPTNNIAANPMPAGSNPEWMEYLKKNGMGLAKGLAGLYMGQRQAGMMGKARSQLDQLYAPGSPYATQMRSNIMRHDAAAGRRSQVAPREVQLAAGLTNARSQQLASPGYMNLMQGQQGGTQQSIGTLLNLMGNPATRGMFTELPSALSSLYGS